MSKINLEFRLAWNERFPDIPCWTDSEDENREFRPIKSIYDSSSRDKPFRSWVKFMGYKDVALDFCLKDYKLAVEIDGGHHNKASKALSLIHISEPTRPY